MKKIIATVLAMVMALALCTTAFAAVVTADAGKVLKETYYEKDGDENDGEYYTDKDCTKLVTAEVKEVLDNGGYEALTLKAYKSAAAATCTADGWAVNVYIDADKNLYVKAADVAAYNDKYDENLLHGATERFIGTKMANVEKYLEAGTATAPVEVKLAKGHVLVETDDVYGESKATVYKCVLCNTTYVLENDVIGNATDKAATAKLTRINYVVKDAADIAVFDKGYLNATLADEGTYIEIKAGTATDTKADGTTSPKTFDAGIAMYVGMALTSVAGSAVVIGKKKEF